MSTHIERLRAPWALFERGPVPFCAKLKTAATAWNCARMRARNCITRMVYARFWLMPQSATVWVCSNLTQFVAVLAACCRIFTSRQNLLDFTQPARAPRFLRFGWRGEWEAGEVRQDKNLTNSWNRIERESCRRLFFITAFLACGWPLTFVACAQCNEWMKIGPRSCRGCFSVQCLVPPYLHITARWSWPSRRDR